MHVVYYTNLATAALRILPIRSYLRLVPFYLIETPAGISYCRAVIHDFLKELSMLISFLRDDKLYLAPVSHGNALNNMAAAIQRNTWFKDLSLIHI